MLNSAGENKKFTSYSKDINFVSARNQQDGRNRVNVLHGNALHMQFVNIKLRNRVEAKFASTFFICFHSTLYAYE